MKDDLRKALDEWARATDDEATRRATAAQTILGQWARVNDAPHHPGERWVNRVVDRRATAAQTILDHAVELRTVAEIRDRLEFFLHTANTIIENEQFGRGVRTVCRYLANDLGVDLEEDS